jgi:dolichol kinase
LSRDANRQAAEIVIQKPESQINDPSQGSVSVAANGRQDISIAGEILRKLTHIGAISIPIIYYINGKQVILILLAGGVTISLLVDLLRFFGHGRSKDFIYRHVGLMIRPHEKTNFTGATYILASSILTILIFDKPIAILAIGFIVVGDTAGAIVGRLWGRNRYRNKTVEGSASFFVACCLVAMLVSGIPLWVKILGAFIATIVEALTIYVDDNLTVPLISGMLMQVIVNQLAVL